MDGFRSNPKLYNSEETFVFGHIFKSGFNPVYVPKDVSPPSASPPSSIAEPGQCSKENTISSNGLLNYISQLLMDEEDEESVHCPSMLHNSLALQATEKSLYDALNNNNPDTGGGCNDNTPNISSGVNRTRYHEDGDWTEERKPHMSNVVDESESQEMNDDFPACTKSYETSVGPDDLGRRKAKKMARQSKRGGNKPDIVDLRSLLMQSVQAAADFDNRNMSDLLRQIRKNSSPQGDSMERVANWFVNALEARMAGTGSSLYAKLNSKRISTTEMLTAYRMYIKVCPFRYMTNYFSATTISDLVKRRATTSKCVLHIIDFGILHGYQWSCVIQTLASVPGGPPKLRITGIDFPQPGFRSAERVVETGSRLAKFCERWEVPFVYNAIAQQWDTIQAEDLKIQKDELLVVNSMYRLHQLLDETETGNSPRDTVLKLINKINPDVFIHGIINASYTTPFFVRRFKEAFYHFSSLFDMLEATVPGQDQAKRLFFEEQILGKQLTNAIACEGLERIERPDTYKYWKLITRRCGFRQLRLDQETLKGVMSKIMMSYHKDFWMDADEKWFLLGWKGRVIHAISCWEPDNAS